MKAMVLHAPGQPLQLLERPDPQPGAGEVRLRVAACAVCRTDLHVVDGELPHPRLPLVPGHEIVGQVEALGPGVNTLQPGQMQNSKCKMQKVGCIMRRAPSRCRRVRRGMNRRLPA